MIGSKLNANTEMTKLIINSLRHDLSSSHELHQCLALAAVCNIGAREMTEAFSPLAKKLLQAVYVSLV